jgi:hypothetical protein
MVLDQRCVVVDTIARRRDTRSVSVLLSGGSGGVNTFAEYSPGHPVRFVRTASKTHYSSGGESSEIAAGGRCRFPPFLACSHTVRYLNEGLHLEDFESPGLHSSGGNTVAITCGDC